MTTVEEMKEIIPLKCWFILREDLQYSSYRLLNIGIKNIVQPFHRENLREEWIKYGAKFDTYMMFNMAFIDKLENTLIENGVLFKWIYDNKTPVGILIEPTRFYFREPILSDCMSLDEYAKHRLEEFNELTDKFSQL